MRFLPRPSKGVKFQPPGLFLVVVRGSNFRPKLEDSGKDIPTFHTVCNEWPPKKHQADYRRNH